MKWFPRERIAQICKQKREADHEIIACCNTNKTVHVTIVHTIFGAKIQTPLFSSELIA